MAKQQRFMVIVIRVLSSRASHVPDEKREIEVQALHIAGAISKAMKEIPDWFSTPTGVVQIEVFSME